jgi:hypothetical protein
VLASAISDFGIDPRSCDLVRVYIPRLASVHTQSTTHLFHTHQHYTKVTFKSNTDVVVESVNMKEISRKFIRKFKRKFFHNLHWLLVYLLT